MVNIGANAVLSSTYSWNVRFSATQKRGTISILAKVRRKYTYGPQ